MLRKTEEIDCEEFVSRNIARNTCENFFTIISSVTQEDTSIIAEALREAKDVGPSKALLRGLNASGRE